MDVPLFFPSFLGLSGFSLGNYLINQAGHGFYGI
jgi:hypothetical protein